jgi:hypothetical protein
MQDALGDTKATDTEIFGSPVEQAQESVRQATSPSNSVSGVEPF